MRQPRTFEHKEEDFLTLNDFIENDQSGDRPEIMCHVIKVLTGINIKA